VPLMKSPSWIYILATLHPVPLYYSPDLHSTPTLHPLRSPCSINHLRASGHESIYRIMLPTP
ncbi:uncharacterized protein EI90DRAFT_3063954, partial [Cantharellus anzutake]|uniref:uncharacterized protein n=1 Tax=Cantharellus anzutake TaxID=1750568 RepID=UPI001907A001